MRANLTVFVSSTFRDLEQHRRAVIDALRDMAWLKVMESKGAAPGTIAENCLGWVQTSNVYVGILGMRYGSREPISGLSFTELEYDEATRLQLPCFVYMIDEERHMLRPTEVDRGKDAGDLDRFKARVCSQNLPGLFRSPDHLAHLVFKDIFALFDDHDAWLPKVEGSSSPNSQLGDNVGGLEGVVTDLGTSASLRTNMEREGWQIQLCAWGSPRGVLDLDQRSAPPEADDADAAAAVLITRFARGDFTDLRNVISLRPEIRNALRSFLSVRDIDEAALAKEILSAQGALYTRLLVDLAGLAASRECVEAVCGKALRKGHYWDREIQALGYAYQMRSLLAVCADALGHMPPACASTIAQYVEKARTSKRWQAKDAFEKALRTIHGGLQ
jgi:hypothetical protein